MRDRSPLEQVLLQRVSDHPGATWLKWQESTYTWAEALSNIRRAANLPTHIFNSSKVTVIFK
jgi:hypothetical protein